jgi:hypothetical protein
VEVEMATTSKETRERTRRQIMRTDRLTPMMFDVLVENWNGLSPMERRERAAKCKGGNHDIVTSPYGTPVCRTCVQHFDS